MKSNDLEVKPNFRGFMIANFKDANAIGCSIQESSACPHTEEDGCMIWLGVDDAAPMVLAQEAHLVGVKTHETTGWVPYPVPDNVLMRTRMHLTQKQVKELLPLLKHFAKTGGLPFNEKKGK